MKFNSFTSKTIFFIALNFLAVNNLFAQVDKAWYKPKVYAESFKLDRDSCATPGQNQTGFNNCMGQRGWTSVDRNILNVVGGCCGTTPDHIKAIAQVAANYSPRKIENQESVLS